MNKLDLKYAGGGEFSKKLFMETYGCQMNVADSEVVASVMQMAGYGTTDDLDSADAIFINTCSVRDNAEQRIFARLNTLNALRRRRQRRLIIGIIGCMAERMKDELINNHGVDLVAGPDSYLELPNLIAAAENGEKAINVELSTTETYRDVIPTRLGSSRTSGFISIMRGCNNFCTYCIVPYTRGRERSREPQSILNELHDLQAKGFKEVTLLGQNVNSYLYKNSPKETGDNMTASGANVNSPSKIEGAGGSMTTCDNVDFAALLAMVAEAAPKMRVRFTTSNPEDLSDAIIDTMASHARIARIRTAMPDCGISTDMFTGFHDETEEDFQETLTLMREVGFDSSFMFKYSERPGTFAAKRLPDNVPEDVKIDRLNRMIALQNELSLCSNRADVGKTFEVLVEGYSKRSHDDMFGRTQQNKVIVFPAGDTKIGDFVTCTVEKATSATLIGKRV